MLFTPDKQVKGLYKKQRATDFVWVVRAKQRGINKPVTVTLGRTNVISVRDARRSAKENLLLLAQGHNPNQKRKAKLEAENFKGISLEEAFSSYLELRSLKPSTEKSYKQVVARCFGDWLDRPIRNISREDVLKKYQSIQSRIKKRSKRPEKANPRGLAEAQKAMRYLNAILNTYLNDTDEKGNRVLPNGNPVAVLKDKRVRNRLKPRVRYLKQIERETLYEELTHTAHPQYKGKIKPREADFVFLLMVSGLRFDEARLLRQEDITATTYTVKDTKNNQDHTLPITLSLKEIFERNSNDSEWLFAGRKGQPASMSNAIKNVSTAIRIKFSAHDLRRTAATIAAEHGYSSDQISRLLNHKQKNVTQEYIQKTLAMLKPIVDAIEEDIFGISDYEVGENTSIEF